MKLLALFFLALVLSAQIVSGVFAGSVGATGSPPVANPTTSNSGGSCSGNDVTGWNCSGTTTVSMLDATSGSTILYTNNGTTPACPSTGTTYSTGISTAATTTYQMIGCKAGLSPSSVVTVAYTIGGGGGAITFDTSRDCGDNGGTTNSWDCTYTLGTGTNGMILVGLSGDVTANDITSVTYNTSITCTEATDGTNNGEQQGDRWNYMYICMTGSTSGAHTLHVASSTNHFLLVVAASYFGVKQTSNPNALSTAGSQTASPQIRTVTPTAANSWVLGTAFAGFTPVAGTSTTLVVVDSRGLNLIPVSSLNPVGMSPVSINYTYSQVLVAATIAAAFTPN